MKTLKAYLLEDSSESVNTKEVVGILKKGGESNQEIKKEVDTNKSKVSYPELVKLFTKKCTDWVYAFVKMHQKNQNEEGKDYLTRNLGEKWGKYYQEAIHDFGKAITELKNVVEKEVNEVLDVKRFDNYKQFYDYLIWLNTFDDKMTAEEKKMDLSDYQDLLKLRLNVSETIKKLFKTTDHLKAFLDAVYNYMHVRL